jgi:tetratricopeptide (TPR) repeat protein
MLLAAGELDAAYRDAEAGLEQDPGNAYLHVVQGQVHAGREEYADARAAFDRAVAADAAPAGAWSGRASVRYELGDADGALDDLLRAMALTPGDPALLYNRAFVYQSLDRWSEALADLDAAAELAPDDPDVLEARDRCRSRLTAA